MFTHIRIYDLGALVISGVAIWLAFLFFLPVLAGVWFFFKGQISADELTRAVVHPHWQSVVLAVVYLVICAAAAYGLHYCWKRPAFFTIDDAGEWACRNSFYYAQVRIHPQQSRQIKAQLRTWFDQDINETVVSGSIHVESEFTESFTFPYSGSPLPDGRADLFVRLGYPQDFQPVKDAEERFSTPPHTWSATGPVFLSTSPTSAP